MPVAAANDNVNYRIGSASSFFIVATGVFFDALGFLLMLTGLGEIMTEIIGITGSILFFFWFVLLRVGFMSGKATTKLGIMGAGTIIEAIPFINGISPTFTIETVSLILVSRKEDREKHEQEKLLAVQAQQVERMKLGYMAQRARAQQQVRDSGQNNEEESRVAA